MNPQLNQLTKVADFDKAYLLAQQAYEEGFRGATFSDLYLWLKTKLDLLGLSNTAGLPEEFPEDGDILQPYQPLIWTILGPGTYPQAQGPEIVVGAEEFVFAQSSDGESFDRVLRVEMPTVDTSGLVEKDYILASINLFNKENLVEGYYNNYTTGALLSEHNSAMSNVIKVKADTLYRINGRNSGYSGVVIYDETGNPLKPKREDGTEYAYFQLDDDNGVFRTPASAVSIQICVKFVGNGTYDGVMLTEGSQEYIDYIPYQLYINKDLIYKDNQPTVKHGIIVHKNTSNIYFRSSFNTSKDIVVGMDNSGFGNSLFNLHYAALINQDDAYGAEGITLNGVGGDDSQPTFFNNTIVGGNHGRYVQRITTTHGKTLKDVGAVYTDGINEFVILRINGPSDLIVGARLAPSPTNWLFPSPTTDLTYVSNGDSTSSISITGMTYENQLYPSVKNVSQKLIIDGVDILSDGEYSGNSVQVIETYDIIDTVDMVSKLISNRPPGGYLVVPTLQDGDSLISIKTVFDVKKGGSILLLSSWMNNKEITLDYYGISQNGYSSPSWATTVQRYYPSLLPITDATAGELDFRQKISLSGLTLSSVHNFTFDKWEDGRTINRSVDILRSSSLNVNFNFGYLPIGAERSEMVNSCWVLSNSKKQYPKYFDNKIAGPGDILPAGTSIQGVAFRGWSMPTGIRTNEFLIQNGNIHYLHIDYHLQGKDEYKLPNEFLGKKVTVINKSSNVKVSSIVLDSIDIEVESNIPMYGYLDLMIHD